MSKDEGNKEERRENGMKVEKRGKRRDTGEDQTKAPP